MWARARAASPRDCQIAEVFEVFYSCLGLCSLREEAVCFIEDQQYGEENQTPTTPQKIRYHGRFSLYFMRVLSLDPIADITCISRFEW